jgi:hypothetical protein
MAEAVQCENCGAVLLPEDVFCGECGAPRPSMPQPDEPLLTSQATAETAPVPPSPVPPAPPVPSAGRPSLSGEKGWRTAFIALVVLGAIACVVGIAAFLIFGSIPGENTTPQEDWIYATICCLLPIGGSGALLGAAGGVIWYTRLRKP